MSLIKFRDHVKRGGRKTEVNFYTKHFDLYPTHCLSQGFGKDAKGTVNRVNWRDAKCMAIAADVSSYDGLHSAIRDACVFFHRGVACIVNNAGVSKVEHKQSRVKEFIDTS